MPIVLLESDRVATCHLVSVHARDIRVQSGSRILFSRESDPRPLAGGKRAQLWRGPAPDWFF